MSIFNRNTLATTVLIVLAAPNTHADFFSTLTETVNKVQQTIESTKEAVDNTKEAVDSTREAAGNAEQTVNDTKNALQEIPTQLNPQQTAEQMPQQVQQTPTLEKQQQAIPQQPQIQPTMPNFPVQNEIPFTAEQKKACDTEIHVLRSRFSESLRLRPDWQTLEQQVVQRQMEIEGAYSSEERQASTSYLDHNNLQLFKAQSMSALGHRCERMKQLYSDALAGNVISPIQ